MSNRQVVRSRSMRDRTTRDVLDDALRLVAAGQGAVDADAVPMLAAMTAVTLRGLGIDERIRLVAMLGWVAAAIAAELPDGGAEVLARIDNSIGV